MVASGVESLFKGKDPFNASLRGINANELTTGDHKVPISDWLGLRGLRALNMGGEDAIEALWGMDAYLTGQFSLYRVVQSQELLANINLGSTALWHTMMDNLRISSTHYRQLKRLSKSKEHSESVRRLAMSIKNRVFPTKRNGEELTLAASMEKELSKISGKLMDNWFEVDRRGVGWGEFHGEHALRVVLEKESSESNRKGIYIALHNENPAKIRLWKSLHKNRIGILKVRNISWNKRREKLWKYEADGLLNLKHLGREISGLSDLVGKSQRKALLDLDLVDPTYPWNIPYLSNLLETANAAVEPEIDFNTMFYEIMERMGMGDVYTQNVRLGKSKTATRAIPINPPKEVALHIDENIALYEILNKIHDLGHILEMTQTNAFLPGMFRLNMNGSVGTEIVAMLVQFAGYCELGNGDLDKYGIHFNDGRERGIERFMSVLSGSFARTEFEDQIYRRGFEWSVAEISRLDASIKAKYGIRQLHSTDWANDMRLLYYQGYDLNYIYGVIGAMQMYEYAECNFGGLFNVEAGLWLADNYCKYGDAISWRDKIKLATGEELNPEYLLTAMRGMDWKTYYQKRVKEVKLNSATNN